MNSMNEILAEVTTIAGELSVKEVTARESIVSVEASMLNAVLELLKRKGFSHLSLITGVDRIKDGVFEVFYTLFRWETGETLLEKFSSPPYGWTPETIIYSVACLIRGGKVL